MEYVDITKIPLDPNFLKIQTKHQLDISIEKKGTTLNYFLAMNIYV